MKYSDAVTELRHFQEYRVEEALYFIYIHQEKDIINVKSKLTKLSCYFDLWCSYVLCHLINAQHAGMTRGQL